MGGCCRQCLSTETVVQLQRPIGDGICVSGGVSFVTLPAPFQCLALSSSKAVHTSVTWSLQAW